MNSRPTQPRVRNIKVAEVVADALRTRILTGELADGELLPKQGVLLSELGASRESLRQALQILETEGLVRVRRGNIGGVEVHRPSIDTAAYMVALVLESAGTTLDDIAQTLLHLEPECAGLCAARPDRLETVVPYLREAQERVKRGVDDVAIYASAARLFHRELALRCGSQSLSTLTSTMESIFATHEAVFIERTRDSPQLPGIEHRRKSLKRHERLIDVISAGDVAQAKRVARSHLIEGQGHALRDIGGELIRVSTLRGWELSGSGTTHSVART